MQQVVEEQTGFPQVVAARARLRCAAVRGLRRGYEIVAATFGPLPIPARGPRIPFDVTEPAPYTFLDVPTLLENSQPRPRAAWMGYAAGGVVLVLLIAALNVKGAAGGLNAARAVSAATLLVLV